MRHYDYCCYGHRWLQGRLCRGMADGPPAAFEVSKNPPLHPARRAAPAPVGGFPSRINAPAADTLGKGPPNVDKAGMKQLMAGGGVALIGITLVPLLSGLFG